MAKSAQTSELNRLAEELGLTGVVLPTSSPTAGGYGQAGRAVFISTVGPYDPRLFGPNSFLGEKRMVDGYLAFHGALAARSIPSVLIIRDIFAQGLRVPSTGGYLGEDEVGEMVARITDYSIGAVASSLGSQPPQTLFRVVRESQHMGLDPQNMLRLLAACNLRASQTMLADLDLRNALDVFALGGEGQKRAACAHVVKSFWGSYRWPILLEWEGMVERWIKHGIAINVAIAKVPTIRGPRDTRKFYEASIEKANTRGAGRTRGR